MSVYSTYKRVCEHGRLDMLLKHRLWFSCTVEGMSQAKSTWADQFGSLPPAPRISKTDEDFQKLGVEFVEVKEGIKVTELNELFEKVHCRIHTL